MKIAIASTLADFPPALCISSLPFQMIQMEISQRSHGWHLSIREEFSLRQCILKDTGKIRILINPQ
jgi:hypothetical protein